MDAETYMVRLNIGAKSIFGVGTILLKSAGRVWKTSRAQAEQTVAELQQGCPACMHYTVEPYSLVECAKEASLRQSKYEKHQKGLTNHRNMVLSPA